MLKKSASQMEWIRWIYKHNTMNAIKNATYNLYIFELVKVIPAFQNSAGV